jgi:hypothetical protein
VRRNGESVVNIRHVDAPGVFNEDAFRALDRAVQIAGQHEIRLIISFVDGQGHWGGPADYAAFRGKPPEAFWDDPQIKTDFKRTIAHLLNRKNHFTGMQYRDDPTVFAWQLGNELSCTYSWSSEMAAYVKRLAPNQLVASGHYVRKQEIPDEYLKDPNIDIIDPHYYGYHGYLSLAAKFREHVALTAGKRPMIVGEFGMDSTAAFTELIDAIIAVPSVAGGMLWNLRVRSAAGGFFRKDGSTVNGVFFRGYRWPGFEESGGAWDERGALAALREKAFQIRGLDVPPVPVPSAPLLFEISTSGQLHWRGSTGAASYVIERATAADGPWAEIATCVVDDRDAGEPHFCDPSIPLGTVLFYRIHACNESGISKPSNAAGPSVVGTPSACRTKTPKDP